MFTPAAAASTRSALPGQPTAKKTASTSTVLESRRLGTEPARRVGAPRADGRCTRDDLDAALAESVFERDRDVVIRSRDDPRPVLDERDATTEIGQDRGELAARVRRPDDADPLWQRAQAPDVLEGQRQLRAGIGSREARPPTAMIKRPPLQMRPSSVPSVCASMKRTSPVCSTSSTPIGCDYARRYASVRARRRRPVRRWPGWRRGRPRAAARAGRMSPTNSSPGPGAPPGPAFARAPAPVEGGAADAPPLNQRDLAPNSAACRAAETPAGPPPITTTRISPTPPGTAPKSQSPLPKSRHIWAL